MVTVLYMLGFNAYLSLKNPDRNLETERTLIESVSDTSWFRLMVWLDLSIWATGFLFLSLLIWGFFR